MEIYCDGSCRGNGTANAEGGFGVVVVDNGEVVNTYAEMHKQTTNNRMEMMAIMWAIVTYYEEIAAGDVVIFSDSQYAVNTFSNWIWSWYNRGWKKSNKQTPENLTLLKKYVTITNDGKLPVQLRYVRGHNGNIYNEWADALATGARKAETTKGEKIDFEL